MGSQAQALRELLNRGEKFVAADVYSALTARIVQHVGFKVAYLGGAGCGAMHYAVPDIGILSQSEQIEQAARIVHAIDIPLIVDADTLGETVADAFHLTRRYEQAGVAGFHVEDEVNPKHSTYDGGLLSIVEMQSKVEACVKARRDPALVIIARCDELYASARGGGGGGSMPEAKKRGRAYAEAGADLIVYPMASTEAITDFARELPVPVCTLTKRHPDAAFSIYTGWSWSAAARLHLQLSQQLFAEGELSFVPSFDGKEVILEQILYGDLVADWAKKTGRPIR